MQSFLNSTSRSTASRCKDESSCEDMSLLRSFWRLSSCPLVHEGWADSCRCLCLAEEFRVLCVFLGRNIVFVLRWLPALFPLDGCSEDCHLPGRMRLLIHNRLALLFMRPILDERLLLPKQEACRCRSSLRHPLLAMKKHPALVTFIS